MQGELVVSKEDQYVQAQHAKEKSEMRPEDVEDFMDEEELIEDLTTQHEQLHVGDTGMDAELEDYDMEEEQEATDIQKEGIMHMEGEAPLTPRTRFMLSSMEEKDQLKKAEILGIQLPILGRNSDGEAILGFTSLFRSLVVGLPESHDDKKGHKVTKTSKHKAWIPYNKMREFDEEQILDADRSDLEKTPFVINMKVPGEDDDFYLNERMALQKDSEDKKEMQEEKTGQETLELSQGKQERSQKGRRAEKIATSREVREARRGDVRGESLFPEIPDYVFEPVYQRSWRNMSSKHNLQTGPNGNTSEHETESSVDPDLRDIAGDHNSSTKKNLDIDFIDGGKKIKTWNKAKVDKEAIAADDGPSVIGSNDILGTVPILRESLKDFKDVDQSLYEIIPKCAPWSESSRSLIFDLNDRSLVFELTRPEMPNNDVFCNSRALIMEYRDMEEGVQEFSDIQDPRALLERINVSKDEVYFAPPKRKGTGRVDRPIYHSKHAALLHTVPLELSESQAVNWHRPRSQFAPLEKKPLRQQGQVRVVITTLFPKSQRSMTVDFPDQMTVGSLWDGVTKLVAYRDADELKNCVHPLFYLPGVPPKEVPSIVTLNDPIFERKPNSAIHIVAVYRELDWFMTKFAEKVPEESSTALLRPPFAFAQRKELKASHGGKVFLMEYMEEYPILLNHPGMGARLTTYYKKKGATDVTHLKIRDEADMDGVRWKVGAVVALGNDDESPFLGEIPAGKHQLALETGLYTSPAHPFQTQPSDFLIARSVSGLMRIREISGTLVCGQELPLHRIPPPNTRSLKDLQERRIYVYVMRTLRTEQTRIQKNKTQAVLEGRAVTEDEIPCVSLLKTAQMFKGRPINMIKMYFKECKLRFYAKVGEDELYCLAPNARIPTEAELKKMVG